MKSFISLILLIACLFAVTSRADTIDPLESVQPSPARPPHSPLDTPLGTLYQAGTTWYDLQHNATCGRTIAVDSSGHVHVVWTRSLDEASTLRHAFYNVWDPGTESMLFANGAQVDSATRAGFVTIAVSPSGWAHPLCHISNPPSLAQVSAATNYTLYSGAFLATTAPYLLDDGAPISCIWPKVSRDSGGALHVVTGSSSLGRFYYSRAIPQWDINGNGDEILWEILAPSGTPFTMIDSTLAVTPDIASSKTSARVAIAYARPRVGGFNLDLLNSDLYLSLSEDGGNNWSTPLNLTQFTSADSQRTFSETSVLFDDNDDVHIAFTTNYYWEDAPGSFLTSSFRSRIWHWNEATGNIDVISSDWTDGNFIPGAGKRNLAIPSLSLDPVTGYLYCSYQKFDNTSGSESGYAACDAWVTVSTDGGQHWSVGRNVTDTTPLVNPAPAGQSLNERDITLSDRVTYSGGIGYLHLFWELDQDAGSWLNGEGARFDNPLYYQRVSVNEIPLSPLVPSVDLHDGVAPVDDLTILIEPATSSYLLNWSSIPTADQYHVFRSDTFETLFDPANFFVAVDDTFFTCSGCLVGSPVAEFFGVIAARVTARSAHQAGWTPTVTPEPLR